MFCTLRALGSWLELPVSLRPDLSLILPIHRRAFAHLANSPMRPQYSNHCACSQITRRKRLSIIFFPQGSRALPLLHISRQWQRRFLSLSTALSWPQHAGSSTPSDMSLDSQLRRLFPDLPQNLQHLVKTKRILVSYWENPRWYGTIAFALSYRG